jgi:hypothetical protein
VRQNKQNAGCRGCLRCGVSLVMGEDCSVEVGENEG